MVEQFGRRHGLAVDIALDMADVEPPDQVELVERFDTLGGRFHLERLGQRDDRGDDRAVARPRLGRAANEALVDLDLVERRRLQIAERRIAGAEIVARSGEHTSELQSLMRIPYAVFCLKKKKQIITT